MHCILFNKIEKFAVSDKMINILKRYRIVGILYLFAYIYLLFIGSFISIDYALSKSKIINANLCVELLFVQNYLDIL